MNNIILLGLVSFINDISSKMILPILPLYIKQVGGAGLAIGLISGLGESVASLFKMLSGYVSDRTGKRKPFVFGGYFASAVGKLLFAVASTWPLVLIFKILERFGKGTRSAPTDALIAASAKKNHRGRGFGIHRMFDSGGAVLGSVLAFVLFWWLGFGFVSIFLAAGILAFFSLIPLIFVKEKRTEPVSYKLSVSFSKLSGRLKFFILIATLFALGNFSYMFFVLRTQEFFTAKLAIGIPILMYIIYNFFYTLFAVPAGMLSDRIGREKVLLMGYALFGIVCLGFMFFDTIIAFVILFFLYGLNYALVNATQRAFVSDLSKKRIRGTALGTFHMMISIAALPAGLVAGGIWDINPVYTFGYGFGIAVLVVLLFLIMLGRNKKMG